MASNHAIYKHGFLWLSDQKPRKNRWFLKCLGFKNGRNVAKNLERFCRKGLFRRLEASEWHLHGFVRLPGTKPCILGWFQAMYASKWPQSTVNTINTSVSRVAPDSLLPFVHPLLSQVGVGVVVAVVIVVVTVVAVEISSRCSSKY